MAFPAALYFACAHRPPTRELTGALIASPSGCAAEGEGAAGGGEMKRSWRCRVATRFFCDWPVDDAAHRASHSPQPAAPSPHQL
jgi:hypothetical protein